MQSTSSLDPSATDAGLTSAETLRAGVQLFLLTLRRQFWSRQTLVCLALCLIVGAIVFAWTMQPNRSPKKLADQVFLATFVGFLIPVFAISYGASCIGGEREDRTLIYLLLTPLPRPWIYLTKAAGSLCLAAGWTVLTLATYTWMAGELGRPLLGIFLPACLGGAAAYTALFLLLGTAFRHGTVLALSYWFFLEVLFGLVPGLVKRITISFYVKSSIFAAGDNLRLGPQGRINRELFLAVSNPAALTMLAVLTIAFLALGILIFQQREYRDLG